MPFWDKFNKISGEIIKERIYVFKPIYEILNSKRPEQVNPVILQNTRAIHEMLLTNHKRNTNWLLVIKEEFIEEDQAFTDTRNVIYTAPWIHEKYCHDIWASGL